MLQKESKIISFSIKNYIPTLILPKCVMVYGEVISTVYFQIAININHSVRCMNWQKNRCWMKSSTISEKIGYSPRIVNNALKVLEKLQLIEVVKQGKLNTYLLKNDDFSNINQIIEFSKNIESILFENSKNLSKIRLSFKEIDSLILTNQQNKVLLGDIWFYDINLLRDWISQSEKIYRGSSLFFINNIAPHIFKYIQYENEQNLPILSSRHRAIKIGSSKTTVSRYVNSYITAGCLIANVNNTNSPINLLLNPKFLSEYKKLEKGVDKKMANESMICPICKKEFLENRSLSVHISKTKDMKHVLLNNLKKQYQCKPNELLKLYNDNIEDFNKLEEIEGNEIVVENKIKNKYLTVESNCNEDCKKCYKSNVLKYNECAENKKHEFMIEFNAKDEKEIKTKKENIPYENTAPGLLKYFYSLTGNNSPAFGKECGQIKNALKNINADEARITMDYLARRGNIDLRFFNRSINEALVEKKYKDQINVDGTEANLVKMFYDGFGININMQTFVRDVSKIKETMNNGLTIEQMKIVIQYMIDTKCQTLNFIGFKCNEALMKNSNYKSTNENPSLYDRDDLVIIKDELLNGRTNLVKINNEIKKEAINIAKEAFINKTFSSKYTYFEWAWKIGLELDNEMFNIAFNDSRENKFKLDIILEKKSLTNDQRTKLENIKNKFYQWLDMQKKNFSLNKAN